MMPVLLSVEKHKFLGITGIICIIVLDKMNQSGKVICVELNRLHSQCLAAPRLQLSINARIGWAHNAFLCN